MKQESLVIVNGMLLLVVVGCSAFVDGNGRIAGLSTAVSTAIGVLVFGAAIFAAGLLVGKGRGRARGLGIGLLVLYAALLLPAVMN